MCLFKDSVPHYILKRRFWIFPKSDCKVFKTIQIWLYKRDGIFYFWLGTIWFKEVKKSEDWEISNSSKKCLQSIWTIWNRFYERD